MVRFKVITFQQERVNESNRTDSGIGAGKSTVTNYLRKQGYLVIDADAIAHQITEKGSPALKKIALCFGAEVLYEDGSLNRKKLAAFVFSDEEKKRQLEQLTTVEVVYIIKTQLEDLRKKGKQDIVFVDAPLLFEAGADKLTDMVWLVDADMEARISRVMDRDGTSREAVVSRVQNQMDSSEKKKLSAEIIDNSKGRKNSTSR